eukprot:TRINITY_DN2032_c0_g1_i1.p1 TRINITY_DN2032_c0_g1~~TRINITY_DN2032_c0_g1_i1.p1  ORF type:complete len:1215 (-),score=254.54 TRINITY_DN2032_c0_g1_i1:38-3682(-)
MVIRQFYAGKNIFVTGATGFIGKVLLEKILWDLDVNQVYVLIRGSGESTAKERFEDEILASRCFDRLRERHGKDFMSFATSKVVPLAGDLSQHNVGLSPGDIDTLIRNCNVIIHCAASIDFKERLDKAVESNVLAPLRMLSLAKRMKNLDAFVHCSTCYVNANRPFETHSETLPPLKFNPEDMVHYIMKQKVADIDKVTDNLLSKYGYPNTYTFTKAMSENIVAARRGELPIYIVRPAIVGASWKEPVPGWIDSVAAIGAVILYVGVGAVHFMTGSCRSYGDIIPCDHVCNALIAAGAAIANKNQLRIAHVGTSHRNPLTWFQIGFYVDEYWRHSKPKKSISDPSFFMHDSKLVWEARHLANYTLPSTMYSLYAFMFGNAKQRGDAEKYRKLARAARMINDTFSHFTANEWIFRTDTLTSTYANEFDAEDREVFFYNVDNIEWQSYYANFCFGLHKYMLKEEGIRTPSGLLSANIITKEDIHSQKNYFNWIFADVSWAATSYKNIVKQPTLPHTTAELREIVLTSPKVAAMMEQLAKEQKVSITSVQNRAEATFERLSANMKLSCVRFMAWFLKKLWRRLYDAIHVDETGLKAIKQAVEKGAIVLIPTHRSYLDFLILSYLFFAYELPMPRIAAGEDFLSISIVRWIFKSCGAFFLRRNFDGDKLYWTIFSEYVEQLVIENSPVEFFIEGKRSRSGKSLHPKLGMMNMVMAPFLEKKMDDLNVVPISISYDKVLEGELYTQEMLGGSKTRESLNGLLRASKVLRMNWGRINIVFAKPISVKEFTQNLTLATDSRKRARFTSANLAVPRISEAPADSAPYNPFDNEVDKRDLIQTLSYEISSVLDKNIVITPTAIVSTVFLTFRRGMSREELVSRTDWLCEEITARGGHIGFGDTPERMVDYALNLLRNLVSKSRNMYEITNTVEGQSSPNQNSNYRKNILVLSYYRNQLLHLFQWDGAVSCVIATLTEKNGRKKKQAPSDIDRLGVDEKILLEESTFLAKLWSAEFVNSPVVDKEKAVLDTLDRFVATGLLTRHTPADSDSRYYKISSRGEGIITFLCHMFWPFVESYLIACLTLFTLSSVDGTKSADLSQRMGWLGEKMFDEGKINFFESCNVEILNNAIKIFTDMGILTKYKPAPPSESKPRGKSKANKNSAPIPVMESLLILSKPYASKRGALNDLAKHIGKYRKTPPLNTYKTTDLAMGLLQDFPLVSKL